MHDKIDMGLTTYCRTCDRTWNALGEEPECVPIAEEPKNVLEEAKKYLDWVRANYDRSVARSFFPQGKTSVIEFSAKDCVAVIAAIQSAYLVGLQPITQRVEKYVRPQPTPTKFTEGGLPAQVPDVPDMRLGVGGLPDNNPKTRAGALKVPLHLVPPSARHYLALAFEDGAGKYGPANWRDEPVSASVYVGAAGRHLDAYWDGEDLSHDSLVHHLAHTMACCAIILDAMECGTLNDDRYTKGPAAKLQARYLESKK